jgi:hypothetical protein
VSVYDSANGTYFTLTNGQLKKGGVSVTNSVVAHVHAKACNDMDAGGHFLKNTSITTAILENELWASPAADSKPAKQTGVWSGAGSLPGFQITDRTDVKAIIIHEYADDMATLPAPKRVCCDLAVDAATSPAPTSAAGSTTSAEATTGGSTAVVDGSTTTTVAGSTTVGASCSDDLCCGKYEEEDAPCSACLSVTGCAFFAIFNNNVLSAGGQCVSLANATMTPVERKKVESKDKCADLCKGLECTACIGDGAAKKGVTGCVWCDSGKAAGDKIGVNLGSTGSCELDSCVTGASKQTTCSSAASVLVSAAVAIVAAVAMF